MSRAAPHDAPPMPNWPALMTTELACAYTSLARASFLLLACATCGHDGDSYGEIRWEDLPHYPERMTMAALARNAVFKKCGHTGAWIDYRQEPKSPAGTFYPRTTPLDG